jgi:serine/threonine protein kinase
MTPARHERIQQIFEAVVDLPPAERPTRLAELCADDESLLHTLEKLIAADARRDPPRECVRVCPSCSRCFDGVLLTCPDDGTALEPILDGSLLIGDKYRLELRLGRGGMGHVFRARHISLEKSFALKLILGQGELTELQRAAFLIEARLLAQLKHPNIVDVTDYAIDPRSGGVPYLVMEYLDGESLHDALQKHTPIAFQDAVPLFRAIASGIDAAHAADIIHADLKPGNLFLAREQKKGTDHSVPAGKPSAPQTAPAVDRAVCPLFPADGSTTDRVPAGKPSAPQAAPAYDGSITVKLVDFGLARMSATPRPIPPIASDGVSSGATTVTIVPTVTIGPIAGTPPYMAPELFFSNPATRSSDLFAFGVTVYELLTGKLPYGKGGCRSPFTPPPPAPSSVATLPPELDPPLLSLLSRDPAQRGASATSAVDAMDESWLAARRRIWRKREIPRRTIFSALAAAVVILCAAFAARSQVAQNLEDRTVDARYSLAALHKPDPRLLIVAIDDQSLAADARPLADWSDTISRAIDRILSSGARSVAIDLLLHTPWSHSNDFSHLLLNHPGQLTLALESKDGQVLGADCIAPQIASLLADRYSALFGFVNLDDDLDHVIRHASTSYVNRADKPSPSFAALAAGPTPQPAPDPFWIDYSVDAIPKISLTEVPSADPSRFQNRIVLVGSTFSGGNDELPIPGSRRISGVILHALIANTILENFPVRSVPLPACLLIAALAAFAVIALALDYPHRASISLIVAGGAAAIYVLIALVMSRRWMIPIIAPEFAILLAAAVAWTLKTVLSPYPGKEN